MLVDRLNAAAFAPTADDISSSAGRQEPPNMTDEINPSIALSSRMTFKDTANSVFPFQWALSGAE